MPISWDPNDHKDPTIKRFVSELNQLIDKYSLYVEKDTQDTVLIIRKKAMILNISWVVKNQLLTHFCVPYFLKIFRGVHLYCQPIPESFLSITC